MWVPCGTHEPAGPVIAEELQVRHIVGADDRRQLQEKSREPFVAGEGDRSGAAERE
jgi:hypothetical protein